MTIRILDKETKVVLSKAWAWIILAALVVLDAFLDVIFEEGRGLETNVLKPLADLLGIANPIFLTPFVLVIFYLAAKAGAWLAVKVDNVKVRAEELILTTFVIVYGVFDLWLLSLYFLDFTLIKNHFYLIPVLLLIALVYNWWAGNRLKRF